jgi:hypothetical protein
MGTVVWAARVMLSPDVPVRVSGAKSEACKIHRIQGARLGVMSYIPPTKFLAAVPALKLLKRRI